MAEREVEQKKYFIRYPSGKEFSMTGIFKLQPLSKWLIPTIASKNKPLATLDQRAIVEHQGKVVYSPRMNRDGLDGNMIKWMRQNPEWAK